MHPNSHELWVAFIAILIISVVYLLAILLLGGIPAASEFFGHTLGVVGFLLMLMTEMLYTLRKRSRSARWGRVSSWLQFHIVTGLVGPYLVLLHSSWKFNGLAGMVLLMTGIVVVSGFVGRYIYTAIPRSAEGVELESGEIERQMGYLQAEIGDWVAKQPEISELLLRFSTVSGSSSSGGLRFFSGDLGFRINWWKMQRKMDLQTRAQAATLNRLVQRQRILERQRASLAQARRLMALWHTMHVPIGLALFAAAFVHIGAAIYYATLLR